MFIINISDVAKLAGVSKSTVSRVLNGHSDVMPATRERVKEIIKQVDYHPKSYAKAISNQRTEMICMVMPYDVHNVFSNPYYTEVMRGIVTVTQKQGYQLMFIYSQQGEYMVAAKEQRADGIILVNPLEEDYENIRELDDMGFPIVVASRVFGMPQISSVYIDDYRASVLVAEHLMLQNHKHIGIINIPDKIASGRIRIQGFQDVLQKHSVIVKREYIIACEDVTVESGIKAMEQLLQFPDITAVYAIDDVLAVGAIHAIRQNGKRVPEDISIVGFDDQPLSKYLNPPLTTIRHDAVERGMVAANMLFDKIKGKTTEMSHEMDVALMVRDSTRKL